MVRIILKFLIISTFRFGCNLQPIVTYGYPVLFRRLKSLEKSEIINLEEISQINEWKTTDKKAIITFNVSNVFFFVPTSFNIIDMYPNEQDMHILNMYTNTETQQPLLYNAHNDIVDEDACV